MNHRHKMHAKAKASGGSAGVMPDESAPAVVSGNKNVIAAAKSGKSIGKIPGIYAKGRADRGRKVGPSSDE